MKPNVITAERLERAVALAGFLVMRDGPVARPLLDRLARELATLREEEATSKTAQKSR
jgi:hypothetical protein